MMGSLKGCFVSMRRCKSFVITRSEFFIMWGDKNACNFAWTSHPIPQMQDRRNERW
jgi:hypothetical protein